MKKLDIIKNHPYFHIKRILFGDEENGESLEGVENEQE